ncbi:MAG: GNAT family N-acetyltransferase [Xylanivirga thermophila]|jgi:CelD/BcsL family acetyltransferase involved in cellulose biosynthesis|uniref:GNAT family N-acetyltransferase n=1 Tax=Xylanivirga thermophila TaxID=2496273 RepID=UPI0039F50527
MRIHVIESFDEVFIYRDIWNEILSSMDSDIVFVRLEWLHMWWRYHGSDNRLFILMLTKDDSIIGFCPLMKVPRRGYEEVRFIGGDEASYMDFIVEKTYMKEAIEGMLDYLVHMDGRFLINLHGFFKSSYGCGIIKGYLTNLKWTFLETGMECFYTDIGRRDFDDYLKKRVSRNSINTMKRKGKRLKRLGNISFKAFDTNKDDIEVIFNIHDKRWQRKIGSSKFSEGITREFFKELALSDDMPFKTTIDTICINNKIISFIYGFEYNGRYIFYRIGHDDDFGMFSPGEMVLREKIRDCFEEGLDVFDFGAGYEPYKAVWGERSTDVISVIFPSDSSFPKMVYKFRLAKWSIRQHIKKNPRIYHFVKYKLGKIKFSLYPENAKRAINGILFSIKDKIMEDLSFIYTRDDYYIMEKQLEFLYGGGRERYRVEYGSVDNLDLLMDITHMASPDILRRFLKGDRCTIVYTDNGVHCLWFDFSTIDIRKARYSCPIDKNSGFFYEHYTNARKARLNKHILYVALEYLKGNGLDKCYLAVERKDHAFINLLKEEGFKKLWHVRYTRCFGRHSYKVYK